MNWYPKVPLTAFQDCRRRFFVLRHAFLKKVRFSQCLLILNKYSIIFVNVVYIRHIWYCTYLRFCISTYRLTDRLTDALMDGQKNRWTD